KSRDGGERGASQGNDSPAQRLDESLPRAASQIVSLFELNRIYRPLDSWLKRKQVSNLCHCISQGSVASASFNGHLRQHRIVLVDIVVNYDLSFSRVDSTRSPCILCEGAAPRYQRREK